MDTLLEAGNRRRHSKISLMAARSRSMPPGHLRQPVPGVLSPSYGNRLDEFLEVKPDCQITEKDVISKQLVPSRRVSRSGKSNRYRKKPALVVLLHTNGSQSRYGLVNGSEPVEMSNQVSSLNKPLPHPPVGDSRLAWPTSVPEAQFSIDQQAELDLEAQRERVEKHRFWTLAIFTIVTALGTVVLVLLELFGLSMDDREVEISS
ncbi:hypothetical protein TruAng_004490 [Truncatella angustata]|nr:hypothetical protein TruAng_004490 [Truncatella angustata]